MHKNIFGFVPDFTFIICILLNTVNLILSVIRVNDTIRQSVPFRKIPHRTKGKNKFRSVRGRLAALAWACRLLRKIGNFTYSNFPYQLVC